MTALPWWRFPNPCRFFPTRGLRYPSPRTTPDSTRTGSDHAEPRLPAPPRPARPPRGRHGADPQGDRRFLPEGDRRHRRSVPDPAHAEGDGPRHDAPDGGHHDAAPPVQVADGGVVPRVRRRAGRQRRPSARHPDGAPHQRDELRPPPAPLSCRGAHARRRRRDRERVGPEVHRAAHGCRLPAGHVRGVEQHGPRRHHRRVPDRPPQVEPEEPLPRPQDVLPLYMDVSYDMETDSYDLPAGQSSKSYEFTLPLGGRLLAVGGHAHDYAQFVSLEDVPVREDHHPPRREDGFGGAPALDAAQVFRRAGGWTEARGGAEGTGSAPTTTTRRAG